MWQGGSNPAGRQQPPAGSTESDIDRTDHLSEDGIQKGRLVQVLKPDWRAVQRTWHWKQQEHQCQCPAADWLHTSGSKAGHPSRWRRTTSLTGVTTYSASVTNSQKPENDLSSSLHQSTPSSTTRQGLLLTKKRSRKPASHDKTRLVLSTERGTHRSSGLWQRPSNMRVYLSDGSAQTILRAATLRSNFPVPALTYNARRLAG